MKQAAECPSLKRLKDRINLRSIPFSDRGSRLLIFQTDDHFAVRLAERWFKQEGLLSGYRQRPPLVDEWSLTDDRGAPLAFTLTTYPHRVDIHTAIGDFTLAFMEPETLLLALPAQPCGISFKANVDRAQTDRRGGVLRVTGEIRRNIAYTTNARVLHNEVTERGPDQRCVRMLLSPSEGRRALVLNITPRLGFNRAVPDPAAVLETAAQTWQAWFKAAPAVDEAYCDQYTYAWWIMRAGLISTRFYTTREAMTPSKIHYVGVWQWDAFFHALAYRHIDMRLAKDQLRIVLDHQREDGMIPDAVHDEGTVTHLTFPVEGDVTKPPLLAWAAWKLFETDGDVDFLEEIYEPIIRWTDWWFEKNDVNRDGLCEYHHPFSSGLDDSPLWDEGMPVTAPDLNTYLCLQQEGLARIADTIGEREEASRRAQQADWIAEQMIQHLWDPEAGYFWALREGRRIQVRTPFNLFPLLTGRMPREIVDRLVDHLRDERQFWTRYPVTTVARDDPRYDPWQMWRGPTWVNVNYLLIEGLERSGHAEVARELRRRTLEMVMGANDIYEYYHPETGAMGPKAASIYGWSAALFIDLAIQATRAGDTKQAG